MATATFGTFLTKLKTDLDARGGMSGVQVFTAPPGDDAPATDFLWVEGVGATEEWAAINSATRPKTEDYEVRGGIFTYTPGAGADAWGTAYTRAAAILAELENEITDDPSFGGSATFTGVQWFQAELSNWTVDPGIMPKGRGVHVEFTIRCQARKP